MRRELVGRRAPGRSPDPAGGEPACGTMHGRQRGPRRASRGRSCWAKRSASRWRRAGHVASRRRRSVSVTAHGSGGDGLGDRSRRDSDHGRPVRSPAMRGERERKACAAIGGQAGEPLRGKIERQSVDAQLPNLRGCTQHERVDQSGAAPAPARVRAIEMARRCCWPSRSSLRKQSTRAWALCSIVATV